MPTFEQIAEQYKQGKFHKCDRHPKVQAGFILRELGTLKKRKAMCKECWNEYSRTVLGHKLLIFQDRPTFTLTTFTSAKRNRKAQTEPSPEMGEELYNNPADLATLMPSMAIKHYKPYSGPGLK